MGSCQGSFRQHDGPTTTDLSKASVMSCAGWMAMVPFTDKDVTKPERFCLGLGGRDVSLYDFRCIVVPPRLRRLYNPPASPF